MRQYTAKTLSQTYEWAKQHPNGIIHIDCCTKLTGEEWLRWFRGRLDEKVSSHIQGRAGRKWSEIWQSDARRTARDVNTPRLRVGWIPFEFRDRLQHRICTD